MAATGASRRTGRQCRPVMFTLCMSRGPHRDSNSRNTLNKQVKGGYLLRYRRGFFCKGWSEEWVVLYEDSTMAWFADKGLSRPRGWVRIGDAPELLAVGEWTRQVPRRPRFPLSCHIGQLLAIGAGRSPHDAVYWLMAQSSEELNDWMTAISNTLPQPPRLPMEKRLSLTSHPSSQQVSSIRSHEMVSCGGGKGGSRGNQAGEADHTMLSGVAIDWGHGWGWGQGAWAAHTACAYDAAVSSSTIFCHATDDYALGGCDEVDWSAFGDFSF